MHTNNKKENKPKRSGHVNTNRRWALETRGQTGPWTNIYNMGIIHCLHGVCLTVHFLLLCVCVCAVLNSGSYLSSLNWVPSGFWTQGIQNQSVVHITTILHLYKNTKTYTAHIRLVDCRLTQMSERACLLNMTRMSYSCWPTTIYL